jgi:hypothetical protein
MRKPPKPEPPEQPKSLSERAEEEMDLWFSTLSYRDRGKLKMHRSLWGRHGGSVIALGLRHGKTARRREKHKREHEARFEAEQAAYEARRTLPAPIED